MLMYKLLDPESNQIYKHRSGKLFQIICMARSSNDCTQQIVVYKSLEDTDYPSGQIWTRSLVEFSTPGRFHLEEDGLELLNTSDSPLTNDSQESHPCI